MSFQTEDLVFAVERALKMLGASNMRDGALSFLPAGGVECEAKVASAILTLEQALESWKQCN